MLLNFYFHSPIVILQVLNVKDNLLLSIQMIYIYLYINNMSYILQSTGLRIDNKLYIYYSPPVYLLIVCHIYITVHLSTY